MPLTVSQRLQASIRTAADFDAFLPPVHDEPFFFKCNPEENYTLSPALARALGVPEEGHDLCHLLAEKMVSTLDMALLMASREAGESRTGRIGGFFRLRSKSGVYWWSMAVEKTEDRTFRGRMHCYDEVYYLSMADELLPTHVRPFFTEFIRLVAGSKGARVWYCQDDVAGGIDFPQGVTLKLTAAAAPAPVTGAVDCGLTDNLSLLCRRLSDEFALREDIHVSEYSVAEVFLYLSCFGQAFANVQFAFQPIVESDGTPWAVEMLARLHSDYIRVNPEKLISSLEKGLGMIPFGRVTFERAVEAAGRLRRSGLPLIMSCNYSGVQSLDPELAEFVAQTLAREDVPPSALMIELTETAVPNDELAQRSLFDRCRELGIRIALDDLGMGFNSLQTMLMRRYDLVKYSGDIVKLAAVRPDLKEFFRGMNHAVHAIGARICAERVETDSDADALIAADTDLFQGYLFSPAVPLEALIAQLTKKA